MNDYESDRTFRLFHDTLGYEWSETPSEADFVLLNTCSIREKADHKAFSSLGRLRVAKKLRPDMVIAVGGCMAQSQADELRTRVPHVDIVFGTHQWAQLPELVERAKDERKRIEETEFYGWRDYNFLTYRQSTLAHPVAELVTIQNGCDKFCSFCLVPFTRGREMSRPISEILDEVRGLVDQGVREVMFLGQNVNAYGKDRRGEVSFPGLLRKASEIEGLRRIRFMTSHPSEFSEELAFEMAGNPKISPHLHLPIQSGSDRVLARMNRGYTLSGYRAVWESVTQKVPGISMTTDIIVGFPGETDADFDLTLQAVREFEFEDSYSFTFSPRPGTKAEKWTDDFVDPFVAQERLKELQSLQSEIHMRKNQSYLGTVQRVLVEGRSLRDEGELTGRTGTNRMVNILGTTDQIGTEVDVRITLALTHSLKGELLAR